MMALGVLFMIFVALAVIYYFWRDQNEQRPQQRSSHNSVSSSGERPLAP